MSQTPNLYDFATKELAQDATIAYIIAWADPAHRQESPQLHELGTALLRELVASHTSHTGIQLPAVESLCVETQVQRIDVLARINDKENGLILLIEDKVNTDARRDQIETYKREQEGRGGKVVAVYVKTGNTSRGSLPDEKTCGRFLRGQLLEVLRRFPDTGDTIVENFRRHLEQWEEQSAITSRTSFCDLKASRRCQGFYMELERRLKGLKDAGLASDWDYRPNPSGGDIVLWIQHHQVAWAAELERRNMRMYLQIQGRGQELAVRVSAGEGDGKIGSKHMYPVLRELEARAPNERLKVEKAGRFGGGWTAAVARFTNWRNAVAPEGVIDVTKAAEFLVDAQEFIREVAQHRE